MRKAKVSLKGLVVRSNCSQNKQMNTNSREQEYPRLLNELSRVSSGFHTTNLFASDVEGLSRLSARIETVASLDVIASMFLDVMPDKVSNADQNSEILQFSQPNSSPASSDSANPVVGTDMNPGSIWPSLDASVVTLADWPNPNREQATSSNINEWVESRSGVATLGRVAPELGIGEHPLGS